METKIRDGRKPTNRGVASGQTRQVEMMIQRLLSLVLEFWKIYRTTTSSKLTGEETMRYFQCATWSFQTIESLLGI